MGLGRNKLRLYEIVRSKQSKALSKSTSKVDVKRLLKVEGNRSLNGSYDDNGLRRIDLEEEEVFKAIVGSEGARK